MMTLEGGSCAWEANDEEKSTVPFGRLAFKAFQLVFPGDEVVQLIVTHSRYTAKNNIVPNRNVVFSV